MFLAEPRGRVTVLLQNGANGAVRFQNDRVVARIPRGKLPHDAKAGDVVIATRDQGRARRRAERRGVEIRVTQPVLRDAIQRRGRDDAAERARRAEAAIVGHDEQHVGRALRRHDAWRPPGFGLRAFVLITPPNFGSGSGSCLPPVVVVARGEPSSPVTCWALAGSAETSPARGRGWPRRDLSSFFFIEFYSLALFLGVLPRISKSRDSLPRSAPLTRR